MSETRQRGMFRGAILMLSVGFAALVVLLLGGLFSVFTFGLVAGEEFSPDTFQVRYYYYWQIPLFQTQVTGLYREDNTPPLANQLVADKMIKKRKQTRWDLANQFAGGSAFQGDASLLMRYLERSDTWSAWTDDHDKCAAEFWPRIASLARANLYVLMPNTFELARAMTDADAKIAPAEFASKLDAHISAAAIPLGEIALNSNDPGRCVEILSAVLKWDAANPEALKLRAAAYKQNGDDEKAANDEAKLSGSSAENM